MGSFARDMHVLLVHDIATMRDPNADGKSWPPAGWDVPYRRAPYPPTWVRMQGRGRVFYTAMGHGEETWRDRPFQQMLVGALRWATGRRDADVTPNFYRVTPHATELPPVSGPVAGLPKKVQAAPPAVPLTTLPR